MNQLFFREFGQGEPLIILHGLLGASDNWVTLGKQYGQHFHVIVPDQRNHGQSFHSDEFDYSIMAQDLQALVDEKGFNAFNLMGHSMGGKVVMQYALHHPGRVNKLIVADMAPKAYKMDYNLIFEALRSIDIDGLGSRNEAEIVLAQRIENFAMRQFLLKNLTRNTDGFEWRPNLAVIESNINKLGQWMLSDSVFEEPTLFISGIKSGYVTKDDRESIKKHFPNSQFAELDAGHWLHAELPNDFLETTLRFLESK
ncbi:MAG: alpha/beta fold hydrolase [Bacteroidetes bacterium]|nr:alpha/beta fold hydrolase [Bacteroidota bacterium]MDA1119267.1 alpha/beta fold hydrolase [Bacteroidota bacterium]